MTARGWVAEQGSVALQIRRAGSPGLAEVVRLQNICVAFLYKNKKKWEKKPNILASFQTSISPEILDEKSNGRK